VTVAERPQLATIGGRPGSAHQEMPTPLRIGRRSVDCQIHTANCIETGQALQSKRLQRWCIMHLPFLYW
jgi:hypothetical protein